MALWRALQNWRAETARLSTYAAFPMRWHADNQARRTPMISSMEVEKLDALARVQPDQERAALLARVRESVERLPRAHRIAIQMRFGEHEHTLLEVGRTLGVSRERARQIEAEALNTLRRAMRRRRIHV